MIIIDRTLHRPGYCDICTTCSAGFPAQNTPDPDEKRRSTVTVLYHNGVSESIKTAMRLWMTNKIPIPGKSDNTMKMGEQEWDKYRYEKKVIQAGVGQDRPGSGGTRRTEIRRKRKSV
jgi:hypothetical protein